MPLKPEWEKRLADALKSPVGTWLYKSWDEAEMTEDFADAFRSLLLELEAAVRREALDWAFEEAARQCAYSGDADAIRQLAAQLRKNEARALAEPATEENCGNRHTH